MIRRQTPSSVSEVAAALNLPASEADSLDSLTTPVSIPAGRVLMRQGAFGNEVVLLIQGELLVERDGEAIAVLSPGAIVGEQAVLLNEPRNATVSAAVRCLVAVMNRREFSTMLEQCPTLGRHVLSTAVVRAGAAIN